MRGVERVADKREIIQENRGNELRTLAASFPRMRSKIPNTGSHLVVPLTSTHRWPVSRTQHWTNSNPNSMDFNWLSLNTQRQPHLHSQLWLNCDRVWLEPVDCQSQHHLYIPTIYFIFNQDNHFNFSKFFIEIMQFHLDPLPARLLEHRQ